PEETRRRVGLLKHSVRSRAIDVHWHDPETSFVEAVMSRGGREAGRVVLEAWKRGARFDAWTELFKREAWAEAALACDVDAAAMAQAVLDMDDPLPWSHISTGVSTAYLKRERRLAQEGITTPDCSFAGCTGCGACGTLDAQIRLAAERVAPVRETAAPDGGEGRPA
ncbi:MAG: B12-binding domain-containing radical SAM protein, partial [Eggerthellaceae bacterium]|nr:B12-binding domain-containing radical SAM protein [Eggerthellaceae bacterium]